MGISATIIIQTKIEFTEQLNQLAEREGLHINDSNDFEGLFNLDLGYVDYNNIDDLVDSLKNAQIPSELFVQNISVSGENEFSVRIYKDEETGEFMSVSQTFLTQERKNAYRSVLDEIKKGKTVQEITAFIEAELSKP